MYFSTEYFVPGWYCWEKDSFCIKKLEKIHEKGILLKGNVSGFLPFETSAPLYPLARFVNLVQDERERTKENSPRVEFVRLNQLCSEGERKIRR